MKYLITTMVFAFVLLFSSVTDGQTVFKANLDGAQAGTPSLATGTAKLVLNDAMDALTMEINFNGITTTTITAFHIHAAPIGVPGGVVFGLVSPNHDGDGDFMSTLTSYVSEWDSNDGGSSLASQLTNLVTEGLYFNAHTPAFGAGEIRGQILPVVVGDVNLDEEVNLLDVAPFIQLLNTGGYQVEADINCDGAVNLLDVNPFVALLTGT